MRSALAERSEALAVELEEALALNTLMVRELERTDAENAELADRLSASLAETTALARQLNLSETNRQALEAAVTAQETENRRLATELRLSGEEVLQLREMLTAQTAEISGIIEDRDAAVEEADALRRDVATLRELATGNEGVTNAAAEVEGLRIELRISEEDRDRLLAELSTVRDRSQALEAELSSEVERTALAQRELDARDIRIEQLVDQLATARSELAEQSALTDEAQATVDQLSEQVAALRAQLNRVEASLQESEREVDSRDLEIANLSARLNQALLREVEDLSRYRSEFFGRMREVVGRRTDILIVGDRFVFQSEVLFRSGSATLQPGGETQLAQLAATLLEIANDIPDDIDWILRVDGHTDRVPINTPAFPSNWALSTARATSVVQFLIQQGVPAERLAAAGFGEFQPLDPADTPEAYSRNRRIELKLDQR